MDAVADTFVEPVLNELTSAAVPTKLRLSMIDALAENDAVGVIAGYYDENLTIACVSRFFLTLLGYAPDGEDFYRDSQGSLAHLISPTGDFPFDPASFARSPREARYVFERIHQAPVLMRTVRLDSTDEQGRAMWVMSAQGSRDSQELALVRKIVLYGYWSVDYDEKAHPVVVHWSQSFRRLLGYDGYEDFPDVVESWKKCVAEGERSEHWHRVHEALHDPDCEALEFESPLKLKTGEVRWFRSTCRIVRRRDRTPHRLAGVMVDITEQRTALELKTRREVFYRALSQNVLCELSIDLELNRFQLLAGKDAVAPYFIESRTWDEQLADFIDRFVEPDDRARVRGLLSRAHFDEVFARGDRLAVSIRHPMPDGRMIWGEHVFLCQDRHPDGRPRKILMYVQDVTDDRENPVTVEPLVTEETLRDELLGGMNRLVDWYVVCEPETDRYSFYQHRSGMERLEYPANGRFTHLVALLARKMSPMYLKTPLEDVLRADEMKRRSEDGERPWRLQCLSPGPVTAYTDISVIPMRRKAGEAQRFLLIAQDNTKHLHAELKIRRTLQLACDVAKSANEAKSRFLSHMSHDIRTPMNAIVGMSAIAGMHVDDVERVRHCLDRITESSQYLLGLINEVLDLSRIESGAVKMSKMAFGLRETVEEVRSLVKESAEQRRHTMVWRTEGIVHNEVLGDPLHLQQVLVNLVSNAVKYTPPEGRVEVTVVEEPTPEAKSACFKIRVSDNGIGMSEAFQRTLFEPFSRELRDFVQAQQGTGLGMSITKNLVLLMGGSIRVKSAPNAGSTFEVTVFFPKAGADEAVTPAKGRLSLAEFSQSDYAGRCVLLVEDNEINREIALEILQSVGVTVDTAEDGAVALERVKTNPGRFDLVFMDIRMPVMNGYEATRAIRALGREDTAKLPIVAMTADVFAEDVAEAEKAGMNGHVAKPVDLAKLAAEMNRWLH